MEELRSRAFGVPIRRTRIPRAATHQLMHNLLDLLSRPIQSIAFRRSDPDSRARLPSR